VLLVSPCSKLGQRAIGESSFSLAERPFRPRNNRAAEAIYNQANQWNVGGNWVDKKAFKSGNLSTSHKPGDIPAPSAIN
jgi:hypothetical protein